MPQGFQRWSRVTVLRKLTPRDELVLARIWKLSGLRKFVFAALIVPVAAS